MNLIHLNVYGYYMLKCLWICPASGSDGDLGVKVGPICPGADTTSDLQVWIIGFLGFLTR